MTPSPRAADLDVPAGPASRPRARRGVRGAAALAFFEVGAVHDLHFKRIEKTLLARDMREIEAVKNFFYLQ